MSASLESRQGLLLDNLESFLEEGQDTGHMRPGYEGFARVLRRVAETEHQSCLLLTSREKPGELVPLEGSRAPVREPVTLSELRAMLVMPGPSGELLEAIDGLRQRSLIERGQHSGSFTLQPVVLEYVTTRLVAEVSGEIAQGGLARLIQHGLSQAHTRDYVRRTQERLLLAPVLACLLSVLLGPAQVDELLRSLLDQLRQRALEAQGYGPANLVALLHMLRGNLRGLDLSHLSLRGVSLQGIELQDTTLAGSLIQEAVFTEAFDAINGLAISSNGEYWAASSRRGEVRVWEAGGQTLHRIWQAHTERVWSLAFSPDGRMLASGSWDGLVKLWEVTSGMLVWSGRHTGNINSVAFAPDGSRLASASYDSTVKLWDVVAGRLHQTLTGHTERVHRVTWSPDGRLLASGGYEKTIWLWDVEQNGYRGTLQGHTDSVIALAFTPDSRSLLSSGDSTLRLWDIASGRSIRVLQGNVGALFDVDWSPDGAHLVSGGSDKLVTISDAIDGTSSYVLRGHGGLVFGVGWSPDGIRLASSSWDTTIRLWNPATGVSLQVLRATDDPITFFCGVAWSPDGQRLASSTYLNLPGVLVWDVSVGSPIWRSLGYPTPIRLVARSPDGTWLAGGGDNGELYVWDANDGTVLQRLVGHQGPIKSVAWSPDGTRLVSAGLGWPRQRERRVVCLGCTTRGTCAYHCGASQDNLCGGLGYERGAWRYVGQWGQ